MRLLCVFLWCALFLLQSVWADDCNWKIPVNDKSCEQIIKWKVHNDEQATATCLEYFPTTYTYGTRHGSKNEWVLCTVHRQFQCDFMPGSFSIFDKCYFFKDTGEKTLTEYLANPSNYCPDDGKLPIFFTMSQAKHIAKRANIQGIAKMWVNLGRDGRLIENNNNDLVEGFMLHKNLWKVHKDSWWNGDKLENSKPSTDGTATNLFFRTDTDYVRNLEQGQFEIATKQAKATILCEYPAKIVPEQKRYCEKMGKEGLGLNAIYDNNKGRERCLYTTLSNYPLKGNKDAIENFQGCKEHPSYEHKAGLDDGTASKEAYDSLTGSGTNSGTYRVAAAKVDLEALKRQGEEWRAIPRSKCVNEIPLNYRQPYQIFDHFMKPTFCGLMSSEWAAGYPMNECSDFPDSKREMDSNTLAIRKGEIIDVPVPVLVRAICSIETNLDCELYTGVCREDQKCTNVKSWNKKSKKYAECNCAMFHDEKIVSGKEICIWEDSNHLCGKYIFHGLSQTVKTNWRDIPNTSANHWIHDPTATLHKDKWKTVGVVVRNGCKMTVWSHERGSYPLLKNIPVGQYNVPNRLSGNFNGDDVTMDPATADCTCNFGG